MEVEVTLGLKLIETLFLSPGHAVHGKCVMDVNFLVSNQKQRAQALWPGCVTNSPALE